MGGSLLRMPKISSRSKKLKLCRFISEKDLFGDKEEEVFERRAESAFRNEIFFIL